MLRLTGFLLVTALAIAGCSSADGAEAGSGDVTVFAANGLTEPFERLGESFGSENDAEVTLNLAAASTLATQIVEGGSADVFASSNKPELDRVIDAGLATEGTIFAYNRLEIAVQPGNPKGITGLADLERSELVVILGADGVPVGDYAREAIAKAGLDIEPDSLETDVRQVRTKVALGEADAAIVYHSEILAGDGQVEGVAIPDDQNVVATYYLCVLDDPENPVGAERFRDYVLGEPGRAALQEAGFDVPDQ